MKQPTKAQKERWNRVSEIGCCVDGCRRHDVAIHHALTGAGGRKNHDKVLPLCYYHHQGDEGIHTLSRRRWETLYGTEHYHLEQVQRKLGEL